MPTHQTPPRLTQTTTPLPPSQEPITPFPLPTDHEEEDWEIQTLHMVRKAKEAQKGIAAKNTEQQLKNNELAKEKTMTFTCNSSPTNKGFMLWRSK